MEPRVCRCIFVTALLHLALLQLTDASLRLHKGPAPGQSEVVLRGRTVTDDDLPPASGSPLPTTGRSIIENVQRADAPTTRRIVDFALHLKRDILIWNELKQDGGTLHRCGLAAVSKSAGLVVSGKEIDASDFRKGVVLVLDAEDFELCLNRPLPRLPGIDAADNQVFLSINKVYSRPGGRVRLTATVVSGRNVVPKVDFAVHDRPEPEAEAAMHAKVEFEDEPHSRWSAHFAMPYTSDRTVSNSSLALPTTSRLSLYKKDIDIGSNAKLEIRVDANVDVQRFRFTRLKGLQFEWEQELSASISTSLVTENNILSSRKRTGELVRWYIPKLSFKVSIPIIGKLKTGGFIGVNWVSQLYVKTSASLSFSATYSRKELVKAQLLPPRYSMYSRGSKSSGRGDVNLNGSGGVGLTLSGFYGVRPVVGIGLTYTRKKLKWRRWRFRFVKTTKSLSGELGADIGLQVTAGLKYPPYPAYTGSGLKVGVCSACHSVRGTLDLKGKDFGLQTVKNGVVKSETIFKRNLFEIRLGTLCVLRQVCPVRRNLAIGKAVPN